MPAVLGQLGLDVAAAAAAVAAWFVVAGLVYLARRPHEPPHGAPTLDLGEESPAVAGLLVEGFRLDREAVPATLLDLAARGVVELEEREPGSYVARLTGEQAGPLTPYESRVLELLRRRVRGGIVPTQALTTGPADESKRWWRSFRREVVADSQRRGLSRDLLDASTVTALTLAAAVPAIAVWLAAGDFRGGLACLAAAFLGLGVVRSALPQRDTPAGLAAASRWLGVRQKLAEDEQLASAPPIAVALWERYLAYAAAFGVAPGAITPIPMGAESDRRGWSAYGGRWRLVRISYPRLFPLGWGLTPVGGLFRGLAFTGGGVSLLAVAGPAILEVADEVGRGARLIALAILAVPVVAVGLGVILLLRSLLDFSSEREVTGQILRLRAFGDDDHEKRYYVAVDDGSSSSVRAWRVEHDRFARLSQDEVVTATVTRQLRHVRSIVRAPAEAPRPATAPAAPVSPSPD